MATGTVKFYNNKNKFGFIKVDDSTTEIYTKEAYLLEKITDNDRVTFDITQGNKGDEAINVKRIVEEK